MPQTVISVIPPLTSSSWKSWIAVLAAAACLLAGCDRQSNSTQSPGKYPSKTVTIICPWAPGGGTDRLSRFWADALEREFAYPFVVVNRTGGSGAVGHAAGAYAQPDGHTVTMITAELNTMHLMGISKVTYADFEPILQMNADAAAIIVGADARWKTLTELLDDVRQHPRQLKMSGTATGGTWDLARAGLLHKAGLPVDSIVWVPSKGAAPSLVELLGGHVDAVCCSVPEAAVQIEAKQLRALAAMSDRRLDEFPDIPTAKEQGIDWSAVGWRGLAVPKETPDAIVAQLLDKCQKIVQSDDFKQFMQKNGFAIEVRVRDEFAKFLAEQDQLWAPVVQAAGYAH